MFFVLQFIMLAEMKVLVTEFWPFDFATLNYKIKSRTQNLLITMAENFQVLEYIQTQWAHDI